MPFEAAFDITGAGEEAKLEVRMDTFMDEEDHEFGNIGNALTKVQEYLDGLKEIVDRSDINEDEPQMLFLAIERELENSIPDKFAKEYAEAKKAGKTEKAAELITNHILQKIQDFVIEKARFEFQQTEKLQKWIDTTDNTLWGDEIDNAEDIKTVLENIDPNVSAADVAVVQAKWRFPNLADSCIASIRKQYGESGSLLAQGAKAISGGRYAEMDKQIEEAEK